MRISLFLIASIALVSLTACSNEDSEPNVQKLDSGMSVPRARVERALNEWTIVQLMEGNSEFTPGTKLEVANESPKDEVVKLE